MDGPGVPGLCRLNQSHTLKSTKQNDPVNTIVAAQLFLQLAPSNEAVYSQQGNNTIQFLFNKHFQSFADQY